MFLGSSSFSQGSRITYLFIIFFISQTEDLRLFGEFWRGCQRISWVVEELQRKNIYFWAMHTPLSKSFAIFVKNILFLARFFSIVVEIETYFSRKKSWWKIFFRKKNFFCEDFRVLAKYFGRLVEVFSSSLTKLHFTCRENNCVTKAIFDRTVFYWHFRCLARKSRTLGGKFAKCMSKLHSTCPEAIFGKIVFFSEKFDQSNISFETLSEIFSDILRDFFRRFVKFPFCISRKRLQWSFYFKKLVQHFCSVFWW